MLKIVRYLMWIAATLMLVLGATAVWMTVEICQAPTDVSSILYSDVKDTRIYKMEDVTLTQVYDTVDGESLYAAGYTYDREQTPMVLSLMVKADSPLYDTCLALPQGETLTMSGYVLHGGQLSDVRIESGYSEQALAISRSFDDADKEAHIALYDFEYICDITEDPSSYVRTQATWFAVAAALFLVLGIVLIVVSIILLRRDKSHLMRGSKDIAKRGQTARKNMYKAKK